MPSATPETRYAKSGDVNIAYQVVGEGPFDLLWAPAWVSNIELVWEQPKARRFLERLASFSRLILFDKRGTGMSDRVSNERLPTLEERIDDMRAVLDAVGSETAAVLGHSEGGSMALLYAATYPSGRGPSCSSASSPNGSGATTTPGHRRSEDRMKTVEQVERDWATGIDATSYAPSEDRAFTEWHSSYFRHCASPGAAAALLRMNSLIDTRAVLPTIQTPTVVIHRTDDRDVTVDEGRWIAEQIPAAASSSCPVTRTFSTAATRSLSSPRSRSS